MAQTAEDLRSAVRGGWVRTSVGGGFLTQLTAPIVPGDYTIAATRPTGGFAPASFAVVAATPPLRAIPSDPPPQQMAMLPSPHLAPTVAGTTILRPKLANEIVRASSTGTIKLLCGRFTIAGIRATCGAVSIRQRPAKAVSWLRLRPKTFRAEVGRRVQIRFYLTAGVLRRIRSAGQMRMRADVVAVSPIGNEATKTFTFTLKPPKPLPRRYRQPR